MITKNERSLIKAFVDSTDMFAVVKASVLDIPRPKMLPGMNLADYGALMIAHDSLLTSLEGRFDALRLTSQVSDPTEI